MDARAPCGWCLSVSLAYAVVLKIGLQPRAVFSSTRSRLLCIYALVIPTKMLHLIINAPVFPLKCSVSPKNVTIMLGLLKSYNFNVSAQLIVQSA